MCNLPVRKLISGGSTRMTSQPSQANPSRALFPPFLFFLSGRVRTAEKSFVALGGCAYAGVVPARGWNGAYNVDTRFVGDDVLETRKPGHPVRLLRKFGAK